MRLNQVDLKSVLDFLKPCIAKSDVIPMLQNVGIFNNYIVAYNMTVGCIVDFDFEKDWNFSLPFDKLYTFVSRASRDTIIMELKEDHCILKSGRNSAKLPISSNDIFEDFQSFRDASKNFQETSTDFYEGLRASSHFISKDPSAYELGGISIKGNIIEAASPQRLFRYKLKDLNLEMEIIIPSEIVTATKNIDGYYVYDDNIVLQNGIAIYFAKLLDGTFPSTDKFFDSEKGDLLKFPASELKKSLIKIGDFSDESQEYSYCTVEFKDKHIIIEYEGSTSQIKEFLGYDKFKKEMKFSINPYLLLKILDYCEIFSYLEKENSIYGKSEDGRIETILALREEDDKEDDKEDDSIPF